MQAVLVASGLTVEGVKTYDQHETEQPVSLPRQGAMHREGMGLFSARCTVFHHLGGALHPATIAVRVPTQNRVGKAAGMGKASAGTRLTPPCLMQCASAETWCVPIQAHDSRPRVATGNTQLDGLIAMATADGADVGFWHPFHAEGVSSAPAQTSKAAVGECR
jgi:hypothetical protein